MLLRPRSRDLGCGSVSFWSSQHREKGLILQQAGPLRNIRCWGSLLTLSPKYIHLLGVPLRTAHTTLLVMTRPGFELAYHSLASCHVFHVGNLSHGHHKDLKTFYLPCRFGKPVLFFFSVVMADGWVSGTRVFLPWNFLVQCPAEVSMAERVSKVLLSLLSK